MPRTRANLAASQLERSGRLGHVHYAVVGLSFVLTLAVWQYATYQVDTRIEDGFDRSSDQVLNLISERMRRYDEALWSSVAMIQANNGEIDYHRWREFARNLKINTRYPGIHGLGVVMAVPTLDMPELIAREQRDRPDFTVHPELPGPMRWPIVYIEPAEANAKAIGLDIGFENNRLSALMAARDTGLSRITAPIRLVQDNGSTPGFLFFAPYYRAGAALDAEARRQRFAGAIYAPFVVKRMLQGFLDKDQRHIRISISDAGERIYDEHAEVDDSTDPAPMFTREVTLELYGRQ